jgi:hypothetical protein
MKHWGAYIYIRVAAHGPCGPICAQKWRDEFVTLKISVSPTGTCHHQPPPSQTIATTTVLLPPSRHHVTTINNDDDDPTATNDQRLTTTTTTTAATFTSPRHHQLVNDTGFVTRAGMCDG